MRCGESEATPSWDPSLPTPQGFPAALGALWVKIIWSLTKWQAFGERRNKRTLSGRRGAGLGASPD